MGRRLTDILLFAVAGAVILVGLRITALPTSSAVPAGPLLSTDFTVLTTSSDGASAEVAFEIRNRSDRDLTVELGPLAAESRTDTPLVALFASNPLETPRETVATAPFLRASGLDLVLRPGQSRRWIAVLDRGQLRRARRGGLQFAATCRIGPDREDNTTLTFNHPDPAACPQGP